MTSKDDFNPSELWGQDNVKKISYLQVMLKKQLGLDYDEQYHRPHMELLKSMNDAKSCETKKSFNSKFKSSNIRFNFYTKPETKSKNDVDFILKKSPENNDRWIHSGPHEKKRKIVKYYNSEDEARREATIINKLNTSLIFKNKITSLDTVLTGYLNHYRKKESRDNFNIALVYDDVRNISNFGYDVALEMEGKKGAIKFAKYWLNTLAQLHTYGTKLITEDKDKSDTLTNPTYYLLDEKQKNNLERLKKIYDKYDLKLSISEEEVKQLDKIIREDCDDELIHGDIKSGNIVGSYLIDFGNSGFGNGLYDYLRLFKSTDLSKHEFSQNEKREFLKYYLQTKENHRKDAYNLTTTTIVNDEYIDKKLKVIEAMEILYKPLFDLYKSTHLEGKTLATMDLDEKISTELNFVCNT